MVWDFEGTYGGDGSCCADTAGVRLLLLLVLSAAAVVDVESFVIGKLKQFVISGSLRALLFLNGQRSECRRGHAI